jgi:hypothetical protein
VIEDDPAGGLRFRNRHGVVHLGVSRPPPGDLDELVAHHATLGLTLDPRTNCNGHGDVLDLGLAVDAIGYVVVHAAAS